MKFCRTNGLGFWDFLNTIGKPFEKADFPFLTTDDLPRVKPMFDFGDYLRLSGRGEALGYLYQGLGKSLTYVGPALDSEMSFGFNDHTDRHTIWVTQNTISLLERAGTNYLGTGPFDTVTELLATVSGMTHDLGNLLSRTDHPNLSLEIISSMFVHEQKYSKEWKAISEAILYHDEGLIDRQNFNLIDGHPLLWALIIADKMHAGKDRVGNKSALRGPDGSVEADSHIVLNMLIARSVWYIQLDRFVWHLDFSVDYELERLTPLANEKDRIWVPKSYQDLYRKHSQPYRVTFSQEFLNLYRKRIELITQGVKLLFPWLSGLDIVLNDTDPRGKVGAAEINIFSVNWKKA